MAPHGTCAADRDDLDTDPTRTRSGRGPREVDAVDSLVAALAPVITKAQRTGDTYGAAHTIAAALDRIVAEAVVQTPTAPRPPEDRNAVAWLRDLAGRLGAFKPGDLDGRTGHELGAGCWRAMDEWESMPNVDRTRETDAFVAGFMAARDHYGALDHADGTDNHHGAECDRARGPYRCTCDELAQRARAVLAAEQHARTAEP